MFQITDASTNWPAIVGATLGGISLIVGAACAYLTLFINNKLSAHEKNMMLHIDEKFAMKELMLQMFASLEKNITTELSALKGRIEALERRQ